MIGSWQSRTIFRIVNECHGRNVAQASAEAGAVRYYRSLHQYCTASEHCSMSTVLINPGM